MKKELQIIAHIHTDFQSKFGIPRQSGLVENTAVLVFEPPFRNKDAFRGIEEFSHLWLIWNFSEAERETWSPTVRPPKLGGNIRKGVFATRSPFRPNPIGLSSVRLLSVDLDAPQGPLLYVGGADLLDGTPIFDVKPYLAYTDAHTDATGGFALTETKGSLLVELPEKISALFSKEKQETLLSLLSQDPRPAYQRDERTYGFSFAGFTVRFYVRGDTLTVTEAEKLQENKIGD